MFRGDAEARLGELKLMLALGPCPGDVACYDAHRLVVVRWRASLGFGVYLTKMDGDMSGAERHGFRCYPLPLREHPADCP